MSPMACFACLPGIPADSEPRMLCLEHKRTCVLADGTSLHTALERVKPADDPLEGSSLGWLYNPVFVIDSARHRQRGWTSFAGGGMAVLEDRFEAQDPFELWMCERTDMVELLTALSPFARAPSDSTVTLNNSLRPRFLLAYEMREWNRAIEERRAALGRWPSSFAELVNVLASPASSPILSRSDEAMFLAVLADLARKRLL
jgi:hypothetical protein